MPDLTQQRQAEGVVTKAQPTGPNTDLLGNPFSYEIHRFPPNVGKNDRLLHWVKFTPCIQQKSSYSVQYGADKGALSSADKNRGGGGTGLAGSIGGFTAAQSGGVAAILGTLSTLEAGADYLAADTAAEKKEAKMDAAKGLFGAAASGVIISAIKLDRKTRRAASSICLYMPDTVNQQLVNDYDQVSLTQALGKAGLAAQAGSEISSGIGEAIKSGDLKSFGLGGGGAVAEVGGMIAEKTGNFGAGITDVLLFSAGLAQNPQVELLFKSIQNREFLFDYKFVPRNRKEAESIISIIKEFRFHAAPEIPEGSTGRYFIPPSEFDIEFMVGGSRNTKLPRISTCVLQGVDVNYGSAGQWTAFQDGMPVEISLQLRFKEVEIMHKKLIKDGY